MNQNTHKTSNAASEVTDNVPSATQYFGIHTVCTDRENHDHSVPEDCEWLTDAVSMSTHGSVRVSHEEAGLVRWFGHLNFDTETERVHITAAEGATEDELDSLITTALTPRADFLPAVWPAHPCAQDRKRIALCRLIDDQYVDDTFEMFAGLDFAGRLHTLAAGAAR